MYVDDLLFTSNDELILVELKCSMKSEFDMTNLGQMRFSLGIEVLQRSDGNFICQRKCATEVLKRFEVEKFNHMCNPIVSGQKIGKDKDGVKLDVTLYKQTVGSPMYLTATRPNLMFVVSLISRFMACPTQLHFAIVKKVLQYLKGTSSYVVFYKSREMVN